MPSPTLASSGERRASRDDPALALGSPPELGSGIVAKVALALLFGMWGYSLANTLFWFAAEYEMAGLWPMSELAWARALVTPVLLAVPILLYRSAGPWEPGRAFGLLFAFLALAAAAGSVLVYVTPERRPRAPSRPEVMGVVTLAVGVYLVWHLLGTRPARVSEASDGEQASGPEAGEAGGACALWAIAGFVVAVVLRTMRA